MSPSLTKPAISRKTSSKPAAASVRALSARRLFMGRPVRHLFLAAAFVMVGGLVGVLPFATRAIQADNYTLSADRLSKLEAENAALTDQRDLLQSDEEVARIAREEFGLAPHDATVYAIPELRPENGDRDRSATVVPDPELTAEPAPQQGVGSKILDVLVFWD